MHSPHKVVVLSPSKEIHKTIRDAIPADFAAVELVSSGTEPILPGTVIAFVDQILPDIDKAMERLAASAVYTVMVVEEEDLGDHAPELLTSGRVDDLLLLPIRPIEAVSKTLHAARLARIDDIEAVNTDLKTLIEKFEEDLRRARGIQRVLIPEKFPQVNGMTVAHKYLSGLKSGGDYLDFFEFEDKSHIGILMSDATGYGLSSAFLSVILRLAVKLSKDEAKSPAATLSKIFEELQLTMKPNENLSIFYGIIERKRLDLRYASCGSIRFMHQQTSPVAHTQAGQPGTAVECIDRSQLQIVPMKKGDAFTLKDLHVSLHPGDRLTFYSDGYQEAWEGDEKIRGALEKSFGQDPIAMINEFTYQVKRKLESDDDMPAQDCSVMIVDLDKKMMRLAK